MTTIDNDREKWVADFFRSYFSYTNDKNAAEAARKLKNSNIPKKLYRYRNMCIPSEKKEPYALEEVRERYLHMSKPCELNDPFDSAASCNLLSNDVLYTAYKSLSDAIHKVKGIDSSTVKNTFNAMARFIDNNNKSIGHSLQDEASPIRLCSLTETNTNMPMWWSYAKERSGLCIEYDTTNIPDGSESMLIQSLFPVRYVKKMPDISSLINGINQPEMYLLWQQVILTKSYDWRYEREWRLLDIFGLSFDPLTSSAWSNSYKISAVYMGDLMADDFKEELKLICRLRDIDLFQLRIGLQECEFDPVAC